ncbi:heat shock transcription factor, X-linked member 4-like, partial [Nannospalax galili]|uniref:heat shock transcription factor, X-linked member 4-like n=1 Tax=Nannospalax galili TaxID=1026970 RepID=UPI00111C5318
MTSQSVGKDCTPELDPPVNQEPVRKVTPKSSPDRKVDSADDLKSPGDQVVIPGRSFQDNLPPEDQSQPITTKEGNTNLQNLFFPKKLWTIINDETFTSVNWNHNGDMVVVKENIFQREILNRSGKDRIFKTGRMKSFIRQLNRYGFKHINPEHTMTQSEENRMLMYQNFNFQRNKPELLKNISRRDEIRNSVSKSKTPHTSANKQEPRSKKMKFVPPRHSIGLHKVEEEDMNSQQEVPNHQERTGNLSFVSSCTGKKRET